VRRDREPASHGKSRRAARAGASGGTSRAPATFMLKTRALLIVAAIAGALAATSGIARAANPALDAFVTEVLARNPALRAGALRTAAARHEASAAEVWPDPTLTVMLDRVPEHAGGEMPMLQYQISQMIPWPGKLGLMRDAIERQGDARAFGEVKRHFREVHDVVLQHRGAVVKTIGDANMAAFHDPLDALKAACALVRRFHPDRADSPVRLRVSLNVGPCIAVNLNSGIDYFGQTVNVAAKLQACVGSAQIAFPDEERAHIEEISLPLPWANRTLDVCRWDTTRARPDPVLDCGP